MKWKLLPNPANSWARIITDEFHRVTTSCFGFIPGLGLNQHTFPAATVDEWKKVTIFRQVIKVSASRFCFPGISNGKFNIHELALKLHQSKIGIIFFNRRWRIGAFVVSNCVLRDFFRWENWENSRFRLHLLVDIWQYNCDTYKANMTSLVEEIPRRQG